MSVQLNYKIQHALNLAVMTKSMIMTMIMTMMMVMMMIRQCYNATRQSNVSGGTLKVIYHQPMCNPCRIQKTLSFPGKDFCWRKL